MGRHVVRAFILGSVLWKLQSIFEKVHNPWDGKELNWLEKLFYGGIAAFARAWNGYEVHNLDKVVKSKDSCLLIGYHSRATLDLFYVTSTIRCQVLVTHLLFFLPIIGSFLPLLGIIPSKGGVRDEAETTFIDALSKTGKPLMLLPGGTVECLKLYNDRFRVHWKELPGFAKIIVREKETLGKRVAVIPFYTKNSEESLWTTPWFYDRTGKMVSQYMEAFKNGNLFVLPLMMITLLCSLGFFILPAPIKMDTYFGDPIHYNEQETAEEFAYRVKVALEKLIVDVNALPARPFPEHTKLHPILYFFLGAFTAIQNIVVHSLGISVLLFITYPMITIFQIISKAFSSKKSTSKKQQPELISTATVASHSDKQPLVGEDLREDSPNDSINVIDNSIKKFQ